MQNLDAVLQGLIQNNPLFVPALIWSVVWKGIALWRAGRNNQKGWFIAILLINTVGLFEIVYLLLFERNKNQAESR